MPRSFFNEKSIVQMVISNNEIFDAADTFLTATINGYFYEFDTNISDGQFVAFVATVPKLAGVRINDFDLILRADDTDTTGGDLNLNDLSISNADGFQSSGTNQPATSALMNFNPTLTFDGSSDFLYIKEKDYAASSILTNLHAFAVFSTTFSDASAFSNWAFIDFDRSESYNMYIHGDGRLAFSYQSSGTKDLYSASLGNDGLPHIAEYVFDSSLVNETFMKFDGNIEFNENLTTGNIVTKARRFGFIGDGSEASSENANRNNIYYDGNISEIILADRDAFTATETLKIESYLALKYGITLHPSLVNYANSSFVDVGSTPTAVIWDNTTYWNGIAGIIKDNVNSYLDQRVAQSTSAQDIILATDLDFTSSNLDLVNRPTSLAEGSSLLFGNEGSGTGYSTFVNGALDEFVTNRKWLFKEVGTDTGNIYVAIAKSYFPDAATGVSYLISTDDNFDKLEETPIALTDGGTFWYFNTNIADGDRLAFTFTLAAVPAPGAIDTGLNMWIKADKNVVKSLDIITSISDSGLNSHDVSQSTNLDKPRLENDGTFNFNPSVSFDGTADHFAVDDLSYSSIGEITKMYTWVVYNTESTATNNGSFLSFDENEYLDISVGGTNGNLNFNFATSGGDATNTGTSVTNDGQIKIAGFIQDNTLTNATVVRLNGNEELTNNTTPNTIGKTGATRFGYVGDGSTATTFDGGNTGDYFDGNIAEIIFYQDETVDPADITKIESYLAIKYGVTIAGDYVNSNNVTIWDATANSSYHKNIAGIGQDDNSELNQKQSSSAEEGNILTISIDNSVAATNEENMGSFADDLDFLVWGNNAVDNTLSLEEFGARFPGVCETVFKKLDRDWKISNIGSVGPVTISFDLSTIPIPAVGFTLMIDTDGDGDFGTGSPTENSSGVLTGSTLVFTNVTLAHNDVITLKTTSPVAIVIFNNGIWSGGSGTNGAIDNSPADLLKSLEVYSDLTLSSSVNCRCLTVDTGIDITVEANQILTVSNTIDNKGSIFLYDDAQLVQTALNSNTTTGLLYQVIDDLTSSEFSYNYISFPVNTSGSYTFSGNLKFNTDALNIETNTDPTFTTGIDGFGTTLSSRWMYTLNNSSNYTKIDENTAITPGLGVTMKGTSNANRYNFIGVPNNGNITPLSISTGEYAIIGNPYPSAINADIFNTNLLASNITDGVIYFWDQPTGSSHISGNYDGGYATRIAGVGAPASGVTGANPAPTNVIRPAQGFVVTGGTIGGAITFTNSMRLLNTSINSETFYKSTTSKKSENKKQIIRLGFEFNDEDITYHRQLVTTPNGSKLTHEQGKDAVMFDLFQNDAYWLVENKNERYIITSVPFVTEDLELPIGVTLDEEREVTFKLDKVENVLNSIYLFDKSENKITNLAVKNYTVNLIEGEYNNRFSLVFKENTLHTIDSQLDSKVVIYKENNTLNVVLENDNISELRFYDLLGKELFVKSNFEKTNNISVELSNLSSQIYVVKIKSQEKIYIKKLFLK